MKTILIVEDAPLVREPLEAILSSAGYATVTARDGVEGIAALDREKPDLILLDLVLPRIDGVALLSHVHSTPSLKSIPVIVLSGQTDRERIREVARLRPAAYLLKTGFSLQVLLEKIRSVLEGGSASDVQGDADLDPSSVNSAGPAAERPGIGGGVSAGSASTDPAEGMRALKPLLARSDVQSRIERAGELQALSPTVTQVLKLTGNSRCSIEAVGKAIAQDHAIALKIMKLANSAVYTRGEPVDSVQKAVVRIGIERIRQAVLNISVVERFSDGAFEEHISTASFWEHSIACGLIASELARAIDPAHADTAFTLGLLHDVGRIIYAEVFGDHYLEVLKMARHLQMPLEQVESRMLLINHADAMERILRLWNFSQDLIAPIVCHHLSVGNVRTSAPKQATEALMLGLANRLAHAMLMGSSGNDTIYPTQEFCSALAIDEKVIARVESEARQQAEDVRFAMLSHSSNSGGDWVNHRDRVRASLGVPVNPLFVGTAPGVDAVRIFCDQIRSPEQQTPNIAIAHIPGARERTEVSTRLRMEEQAHGTGPLPLLMLSPAGKFMVEDTLFPGRACDALPIPFAIPRFVEKVRSLLGAGEMRVAA